MAGETLYDCGGESLFAAYKDLFKTKDKRKNMIEYGVATENYSKLVSGDDRASTDANDQATLDAAMYKISSKKQRIRLGKVLSGHGLLATFQMNNNFRFIITLPPGSEVLVAQSGQKIGSYQLENIQLEYESIYNRDIASALYDIVSDW